MYDTEIVTASRKLAVHRFMTLSSQIFLYLSSSLPKLHGDVINTPPLGLWQVDEQVYPYQCTDHDKHCCAIGIEELLQVEGMKVFNLTIWTRV